MTSRVLNSGSYEEALSILGEYVNITSVDDPKPDSQDESEQTIRTESQITEYVPTEGIQQMTDRINLLLESDDPNKNAVEELIIELAQEKYSTISEVRL